MRVQGARLCRLRERTNAQFAWLSFMAGINYDDEVYCCHSLRQLWCKLVHSENVATRVTVSGKLFLHCQSQAIIASQRIANAMIST
jgi:hypothetical protein